jgi:hypothetical protein
MNFCQLATRAFRSNSCGWLRSARQNFGSVFIARDRIPETFSGEISERSIEIFLLTVFLV